MTTLLTPRLNDARYGRSAGPVSLSSGGGEGWGEEAALLMPSPQFVQRSLFLAWMLEVCFSLKLGI